MSTWYCDVAPGHPVHGPYHDTEYGFPQRDDAVLFERLVLEIQQAGLSWLIVLQKRPAFRLAFDGFDLDRVAAYGEREQACLLSDAGIIRNRRKIAAVIENAGRLQTLRDRHGSLAAWLDHEHPKSLEAWVKTMRQELVFMGPEVVREFLVSLGYLPASHRPDCPVFCEIAALNPPWMQAGLQQTPSAVGGG